MSETLVQAIAAEVGPSVTLRIADAIQNSGWLADREAQVRADTAERIEREILRDDHPPDRGGVAWTKAYLMGKKRAASIAACVGRGEEG